MAAQCRPGRNAWAERRNRQILALGEFVERLRVPLQVGWASRDRSGCPAASRTLPTNGQNACSERARCKPTAPTQRPASRPPRSDPRQYCGAPARSRPRSVRPVQSQTVMQRQINQIEPALQADPLRLLPCALPTRIDNGSANQSCRTGQRAANARRRAACFSATPRQPTYPPGRRRTPSRRRDPHRTRRRRFSQAHESAPCSPSAARSSLTTRGSDTRV